MIHFEYYYPHLSTSVRRCICCDQELANGVGYLCNWCYVIAHRSCEGVLHRPSFWPRGDGICIYCVEGEL